MHEIIKLDNNDKWFVIMEKTIDGIKYSYMIRVNDTEDDFIDEYVVVKSEFNDDSELMSLVEDEELEKIMPILVPEISQYINDKDKLKELLDNIK